MANPNAGRGARNGDKERAALHSALRDPNSAVPVAAFIGIGSNVGDRLAACREAVGRLGSTPATLRIKKVSSLYETDPVDYLEQTRFYNAVIQIETSLSPGALLERCGEIEHQLGKKILIPKGPRTIDLDLLFYNRLTVNEPGLQIPHPAVPNRAFVLIPLVEIAPDWVHPALGLSVSEILRRLIAVETSRQEISTGVAKIAPPGWEKVPLVSNGPS